MNPGLMARGDGPHISEKTAQSFFLQINQLNNHKHVGQAALQCLFFLLKTLKLILTVD